MALLRAVATVGGYTMLSRLTGFARDILIAAFMGAGPVADAFFVAFKLPNFFRRLFAEGAFNAAFVPLFAGRLATGGAASAREFAEEVLSVLALTLFAFVSCLQIAMPWLMYGFAPGFVDEPVRFDLAVELARLTFPYLLFISLVSFFGGVLNSLNRFAAAAAAPVLLNLVMIGAILALTPHVATPGHALAWGVSAAGAVQFLWLAVALSRAGMRLRLVRPRLTPGLRRLFALVLPGALGAGVVQVNLFVDVIIASLLPTGAISFLYYADRVNELPVGVVGVAVGTALLPLLARQVRSGDDAGARASLNRAVELALLLGLPAATASFAIAGPIVAVLFERGAFGAAETAATAAALMAFSVGLPAYVLVKVLAPAFFAREDTRTPVRFAVICVGVNFVLNIVLGLMSPLAHVGIASSTAIAAWLNTVLLATAARRRGYFVPDARLRARLPRILAAAVVMAAIVWLAARFAEPFFADGEIARAAAMAVLIGAGVAVFGVLVLATGAAGLAELGRHLARARPGRAAGP